ncbi:MAG: calcium-binding EGF-like domain-containing protein, partial [Myxococcota bacterium]
MTLRPLHRLLVVLFPVAACGSDLAETRAPPTEEPAPTCDSGFTLVDGRCTDINECESNNGNCDALTTCTNTVGSRVCGDCPSGYTGNGVDGCVDVDECATNNGDCDGLTSCTNTAGGRTCGACPGGYTGNAVEGCVDINECDTNNGGCDPLTACTNTPGGRTCSDCPNGFSGNGENGCSDTNECDANNGGCDALTSCTNTAGGRTCGDCPMGYSGDGEVGCSDINECGTENGGCDALTTCTNTIGSRTCGDCPGGYTGNGVEGCVDVNECDTNNGGCDALTTCTNTPGGRTCGDCPAGYDDVNGDGTQCDALPFAVGGTVSGLTGSGLVLELNSAEQLTVDTNGPFEFMLILAGETYEVSVVSQPSGELCSVTNRTGVVQGAVTDVGVACAEFDFDGSFGARGALLTWSDIGATTYDIVYSRDESCDLGDISSCVDGVEVSGVSSPHPLAGLVQGEVYFIGVRSTNSAGGVGLARIVGRPSPVVFNNRVYSIARASDGTTYLGGDFTSAGPSTGGGVRLSTGGESELRPFPEVSGVVYASVPDGAGGFFIGGFFTSVGGAARNNLAHVLSDASVGDWNPDANSTVWALAVDGDTVYAGGQFTTIGTTARNRLAAIEASGTGNLRPWDPDANSTVRALAVDGDTVYVGGHFTTGGTTARKRLAAL